MRLHTKLTKCHRVDVTEETQAPCDLEWDYGEREASENEDAHMKHSKREK